MPTGASEASSRGEEGLLAGLRHGHPAHRYFCGIPAWRRRLLTGLWHGDPTHRCSRGIPAWRRGSSGRPLARGVGPQVLQRHPRVAKGRESLPLQGLWSSLRPGSARHPRLQVVLRQGRVAKRFSISASARPPCPQVPQWHPGVAKGASIGSSARRPTPQVPQRHPRVAKRSHKRP